jgi:hypothetical protein
MTGFRFVACLTAAGIGAGTTPTYGSNLQFNALGGGCVWNYPLTLHDDLAPVDLIERMDGRIGLLFEDAAKV